MIYQKMTFNFQKNLPSIYNTLQRNPFSKCHLWTPKGSLNLLQRVLEFKTTFIIKFFPFHCVDVCTDGAKNDG